MLMFQENPEWLNSIKNVAKSADDQVTMILMAVQPREIFYDKANTAEQKLKDLILKNFPESSNAMIIGCTANKVALKCSNVDIFIKFGLLSLLFHLSKGGGEGENKIKSYHFIFR